MQRPKTYAGRDRRMNLYRSRRWVNARRKFLKSRPWCERCLAVGRLVPAVAVDHDLGHGPGWQERFWDERFWKPLCKSHHDAKTAREVHARARPAPDERACDAAGDPVDPNHPWNRE
jgi:hypothetical protein